MSITTDLREGWALARLRRSSESLTVFPIAREPLRIWASLTEQGRPGLVVELSKGRKLSAASLAVSRHTAAIAVEELEFAFADEVRGRGLLIWCERDDLEDVFLGFCEPFIAKLKAREEVVDAFNTCLLNFRALVAASEDGGMPAALVGLLGELVVLDELTALGREAYRSWSYPLLERHDFRNGNVAAEVKTSLRSHHSNPVVSVSAIDQLEPPSGGDLFLHWVALERDPSGVVTLHALVDCVCGRLNDDEGKELKQKVSSYWEYARSSAHAYAVRERRSYRVTEGFPRLSPSRLVHGRLDAGVARVRYHLDLTAAESCAVTVADAHGSFLRPAQT